MVRAIAVALALPLAVLAADRGEAKATLGGKTVKIDYGRPVLQGRDMLGQAQIGKPWRLGADAATTLSTETDLVIGGKPVPKGTYVLTATKVAEGQWQLNVATSDTAATKVAEVPLTAASLDKSVEQFTIDLKAKGPAAEFSAAWGGTALTAPVSAK
jgi:hypothetical protein